MGNSKILRDEVLWLKEARFEARITVLEVTRSEKFPEGLKVKCVLVDSEKRVPRVLLDNHAPHGYHLHSRLPEDKKFRVSLNIQNYEDAIIVFMKEVRKVTDNDA